MSTRHEALRGRERLPALAVQDFRNAWADLPVNDAQARTLAWVETLDQPTLNALADVVRLARAENQGASK